MKVIPADGLDKLAEPISPVPVYPKRVGQAIMHVVGEMPDITNPEQMMPAACVRELRGQTRTRVDGYLRKKRVSEAVISATGLFYEDRVQEQVDASIEYLQSLLQKENTAPNADV